MSYQQPQDSASYSYEPPVRQRSEMPTYTIAPPEAANNGPSGSGSRRRGRPLLRALLTIFTGKKAISAVRGPM